MTVKVKDWRYKDVQSTFLVTVKVKDWRYKNVLGKINSSEWYS